MGLFCPHNKAKVGAKMALFLKLGIKKMAYIREKKTKSGKYYYLVISRRVNGKVVKEETYLGTKPPIAKSRGVDTRKEIKVPTNGGRYKNRIVILD